MMEQARHEENLSNHHPEIPLQQQQQARIASWSDVTTSSNAITPTKDDILCGRGKQAQNWPGNRCFLSLIQSHAKSYYSVNKKQKTRLTQDIVSNIRADGGRFLRFDGSTGTYMEVGDKFARDKVSHALRSTRYADNSKKKNNKAAVPKPKATTKELEQDQQVYCEDLIRLQQQIFYELVAEQDREMALKKRSEAV